VPQKKLIFCPIRDKYNYSLSYASSNGNHSFCALPHHFGQGRGKRTPGKNPVGARDLASGPQGQWKRKDNDAAYHHKNLPEGTARFRALRWPARHCRHLVAGWSRSWRSRPRNCDTVISFVATRRMHPEALGGSYRRTVKEAAYIMRRQPLDLVGVSARRWRRVGAPI